MKFSDLHEGDVISLIYYDAPDEPMRLYAWLRSKENGYFNATDLWTEFGDSHLDNNWQFTDAGPYELIDVVFNVPSLDPLKMLQDLHPELFI